MVQAIANEADPLKSPVWATNQLELAAALNVDRRTINRWLKIEGHPGTQANGRYSVAAWREWAKDRGHEYEEDDIDAIRERARNILLQNQRLEFQIGVMRKQFAPTEEVETWGAHLGTAIRKVVMQLHLLAPSIVGLPIADAEKRLREVEDEILHQLHLLDGSLKSWREQVENESAPKGV